MLNSSCYAMGPSICQSETTVQEWINYIYQQLENLKNGLVDSVGFCVLLGLARAVDIWSGEIAELEKKVRESGWERGYVGTWCL